MVLPSYDFVFVYEIKNRELDSVLLLKCELERRGYTVKIIETWEQEYSGYTPVEGTVAVCFALYDDETLKYIRNFVKHCYRFVNMQWEQIFTRGDSGLNSHEIKGRAKKAIHFSWGENNYRLLTDGYGVSRKNVFKTGNITLDFLRDEFRSFYNSRKEICTKYGIDENHRIVLFISSFSYVNMPESITGSELYQNQGFNVSEFIKYSIESQKIILEWFEKELQEHPDTEIIYRPHPAESVMKNLKLLDEKYKNFHCIDELSVKQWIKIADKIYTWWSTSVAEIYAAHKGCSILRPFPMPSEMELQIYSSVVAIESFEQFDSDYMNNDEEFPIPSNVMDEYYHIDSNEPAFISISNILEKVLLDSSFTEEIPDDENDDIKKTSKIRDVIGRVKNKIKKICHYIYSLIFRNSSSDKKSDKEEDESTADYKRYLKEMRDKNYSSEGEIEEKEIIIKDIIDRYWPILTG